MNTKQFDLIRQGKVPVVLRDGKPEACSEPVYELLQWMTAIAHGYNELYKRCKFLERIAKGSFERNVYYGKAHETEVED